MTFDQIQSIIADIQYKNWFVEIYNKPLAYTIRLSWFDACSVTGKQEIQIQISREWYLDPNDLTEDSIVRTIHKAILSAEEHEVNEKFKYKGKRIFNPHVSIKNHLEVCEK